MELNFYIYYSLLATVRHNEFIILAIASSSITSSLFPRGRTAYSCFKLPIDFEKNFSCNISKQNSLASLIRDAKLIVWNEISMAKKN